MYTLMLEVISTYEIKCSKYKSKSSIVSISSVWWIVSSKILKELNISWYNVSDCFVNISEEVFYYEQNRLYLIVCDILYLNCI